MKKYFILIILVVVGINLKAQQEQFESAFIFQFTKYIEWPQEYKSGDFILGIVGDAPIKPFFDKLAQTKKVVNQNIVVKKFDTVQKIEKCHILYLPSNQSGNLSTVLNLTSQYSTLVIAQGSGLAKKGAGIGFIEKGGKLAFEINESVISRKNIVINSQLKSLASSVY